MVVVGGTNGLGRAIALAAVERGAVTTVVGRSMRDEPSARLRFVAGDLSLMERAVAVAAGLPVETADVLLFTTGIFAAEAGREVTAEGLERDLATSYLNRLAMLPGLAGRLGTARPPGGLTPRVFVMGSPGLNELGDVDDLNAERGYEAMKVHWNTVAGNEALVVGGAERFPGPEYFGLCPGLVRTGVRDNLRGTDSWRYHVSELLIRVLTQSARTYARRVLPVIFAPGLTGHSGSLFGTTGRPILGSRGLDQEFARRYLDASERLLRSAMQG